MYPLATEVFVVLVGTGTVFQRVLLQQRMISHVINVQNTAQIGMPRKLNPKEIEGFPFLLVGRFKYGSGAGYYRIIGRKKGAQTQTDIVDKAVEMVNDPQLLARLLWEMYTTQVSHKNEL